MSPILRYLYWFALMGAVGLELLACYLLSQGLNSDDQIVNFWVAVIIGGFLGIIWLSLAIGIHLEKKRHRALSEIAVTMGFRFDPSGAIMEGKSFLQLSRFENLRPGHGNTLNVLQGSLLGFDDVVVFDFGTSHLVGSRTTSYTSTAVAFKLPTSPPDCSLEPSTLGQIIDDLLRQKAPRLTLSNDAPFSEIYFIYGQNPDEIEKALSQGFRSAMIQKRIWSATIGNNWLILHQFNEQPATPELQAYVQEAHDLASKFTGA